MLTILLAAILIRGEVHDAAGAPIGGARITWNDTHSLTTPANGAFAIDPGDAWPRDLVVSAKGFGTRVIALSPLHTATSLGDITLTRGATLRVHVVRGAEKRPLDIAVGFAGNDDDDEPRWVVRRHLDAGVSDTAIPDLGRGAWIVLFRGPEPLQRATMKAVVAEGDTRVVEFTPKRRLLHARILAGAAAVKDTEVRFGNLDEHWDGVAKTDANGAIDTPLWDGGTFEVSVRRIASATPVLRIADLHGGDVTIAIPDRTLRGTVVDLHGQPVAGATVHLGTTSGGRRTNLRALTGAHGTFAFDGMEDVEQEIRVFSPSFLTGETFHTRETNVRVTLDEGYPRELVVKSRDGEPVAGAEVLCMSGNVMRARTITGDDGRATVPTPSNEASVLFIVPREGSFVVHRLRAPVDETSTAPIAIAVPPASASLRVDALTTKGSPIDGLSFLMRVNGETIPPLVAETMGKLQGVTFSTARDGSARFDAVAPGIYELWPYNNEGEVEALLETIGIAAAPININVTTGENRAAIRFRSR
ncbi:MAG TPA: carboxypeptidase-like regulatory domain-containing protein [Thermoanaerobaculia bacterium]|nr:carboxypeptidase-like regulatory domain-containing protein [Thermoanaerobaculia bacterium]